MTIIFSTDIISRGGKERIFSILTKELLQANNKLFILAGRKDNDNNYLREYQINPELILTYNSFNEFRERISQIKPELVISWDGISSYYNLLLYKRYSYIFINASIRHGIRLFRFSHLFRSLVCHLSPYVIANSEAGFKANNLKPGKRRFILYNGIESKFKNKISAKDQENLKKKIIPDYQNNPGIIYISVANFVPYKDYFTVFKALQKLKETQNFYYLVAGDGPLRPEIENHIVSCGLKENVILTGRTENVSQYLFASDIMIHSSRGEGISNAILEAMYAGLPVIASDVGGVPETVYPGSSMLFPYRDAEALYSCLLKSYELKTSFDPHSDDYKKHLEKFSVESMVNKFENIIDSVTAKTQRRKVRKGFDKPRRR